MYSLVVARSARPSNVLSMNSVQVRDCKFHIYIYVLLFSIKYIFIVLLFMVNYANAFQYIGKKLFLNLYLHESSPCPVKTKPNLGHIHLVYHSGYQSKICIFPILSLHWTRIIQSPPLQGPTQAVCPCCH